MKPLNFNHDNNTVTLFDQFTPSDTEEAFAGLDIVSTLETISSTNIDEPLCDMSDREFTH